MGRRLAVLGGAGLSGSLVLGFALHDPFPWVFLLLAASCALAARGCAGLAARRTLAASATLLLGLAAAELLLLTVFATRAADGRTEYGAMLAPRPGLGAAPQPGTWRCTGWLGMRRLYDVTYGIDERGRRVTGPAGDGAERAALCFGGSFTFGEGLRDDETWPWQLEQALAGELAVVNLGAPGWGPSQMLALAEAWPDAGADGPTPTLAVYLAIAGHPQRVTGETSWSVGTPRYVLDADGALARQDPFGTDAAQHHAVDSAARTTGFALRTLRRSALLRRLLGTGRPDRGAHRDEQIPPWAAVVERSATRLGARFPGLRFLVLFWDAAPPGGAAWERQEAMIAALVARGLEVRRCSRWLADLPRDPAWVIPDDGHPSAKATAALARGLAAWLRGPGR